jgi:hypothetical protein
MPGSRLRIWHLMGGIGVAALFLAIVRWVVHVDWWEIPDGIWLAAYLATGTGIVVVMKSTVGLGDDPGFVVAMWVMFWPVMLYVAAILVVVFMICLAVIAVHHAIVSFRPIEAGAKASDIGPDPFNDQELQAFLQEKAVATGQAVANR